MKKRQEIELHIDDVAFGGAGVARHDGKVVFVERTIPGDRVRARIKKVKSDYAEAYPLEYLERGPGYETPPCSYAGHCGGCKWQELRYDVQLSTKRQIVADALRRIGKLADVPVNETIPSPEPFAYRNKMEFSFSDHRWLTPKELDDPKQRKDFALGLHAPGAFNKVLHIEECHLQDQTFNRILRCVSDFARNSELPVYNLKTHEGFWRFLMLRKGVHTGEYMVNIVTSEPHERLADLSRLLIETVPQISSIVNNVNRRKAQVAIGEAEIVLHGSNVIHEKLGDFRFEISANSFFQTNTKQAEALYAFVRSLIAAKPDHIVFDLYSGTGTIPIYMADAVHHIYGFELVETAVENARENVTKLGIRNCDFICGDVIQTVPEHSHLSPDIVIVDPPRAGLHAQIIETIRELASPQLIYVSCNPSTLARDLALFASDYQIKLVQPFDMFPHTYHIETVVQLERKSELT